MFITPPPSAMFLLKLREETEVKSILTHILFLRDQLIPEYLTVSIQGFEARKTVSITYIRAYIVLITQLQGTVSIISSSTLHGKRAMSDL